MLSQGSVMIQMIPWGWQLPNGWIDRECLFSHQAEAVSAWYFNWVNTDRLKGLQPMCAPPALPQTGQTARIESNCALPAQFCRF